MRKIWLVAMVTYRQRVRSGMFLVLTFGLPVLMIIAGAIAILMETRGGLPPIGYVDHTGQLNPVSEVPLEDGTLMVTRYETVEAARAAFEQGDIEGFLVIPEGYFEGAQPVFYAESDPNARLEEAMAALVRRAMLPDSPAWVLERLADPATVTFVGAEDNVKVTEGPAILVRLAIPALLAIFFGFSVTMASTQMGSAIVREKDQRAMEMVITSLAPVQLVAGKVLGLALLSLTQFAIWALGGGVAAALALAGTLQPADLVIPWETVAWGLLLGIAAFFLYAILAAGLGIIAGDNQQAQQLAGLLGLAGFSPLWFLAPVLNAPDGSLAVGLTLFPLTSPMIALLRMAFAEVPIWQLVTALALIVLSLAVSVWLVARVFRSAMLLYGQVLRPRQIWRALTGT